MSSAYCVNLILLPNIVIPSWVDVSSGRNEKYMRENITDPLVWGQRGSQFIHRLLVLMY